MREEADKLRERARGGESLDDLLYEAFALCREASEAHARDASLRRPDDRRHGAARRLDRRDEDRRGQDADGDPADLPQLAGRRQRPPRDGQRLPRAARRGVDEADLRRARRDRRRPAEHADLRGQAGRLRGRRHLRHQLRVRLRLPARQHGLVAGGGRPARPSVRDRRRGRQHPDRRGAHAADHLRRARGGGRPLPAVRPARADAEGRAEDGQHVEARQRRRASRTTTTSSTRSTRRSRRPSAASRRPRASSASRTCTSPSTATWSTT